MNAKDINVIIEADPDMLEKLAENPEGNYALKVVQRDAIYTGGDGGISDIVYKVIEVSWVETFEKLKGHLRDVLTAPDFSAEPQVTIMRTPDGDEIVTRATMREVWDDPNEEDEPMEY